MVDGNRQPYIPINRRTQISSVSSTSTRSHNPKPGNRNFNSSTVTTDSKNHYDDDHLDFPSIIGICPFMCPVEERARRERLRDLAVFERLHGNPAKTSPSLAVKKFCRTISTRETQASEVRPVVVLEETLNYVLSLLHSNDQPFEVVYDFIFDRTRSIRQDLSMQSVVDDQVICMYERMVKFHIISHHHIHRFSGTPNIASMGHLNMEQLMKALTTLLDLYKANRVSNCVHDNEAEFHSCYLLLLLGSKNQVLGESLSLWLRRIPYPIVKSKEMCFARRTLRYFCLGNYKRFIHDTEKDASYLQFCIIEPFIHKVRIMALSYVSYGGHKLQPYPLVRLSKVLLMKDSDVESLCIDCGLETTTVETGRGLLPTKQPVAHQPTKGSQKYYPLNSERIERLCAEQAKL